MEKSPMYMTPIFEGAAKLDIRGQLEFLGKLSESPFYKPGYSTPLYRDLIVFTRTVSGLSKKAFAASISAKPKSIENWLKGDPLLMPNPLSRDAYAADMIEIAQAAHGWARGEVPALDGSNVIKFEPR